MEWDQVFATRMGGMQASEIRELLKLLAQPDILSFAGGIPDPNLFPAEAFQTAMAEILGSPQRDAALQYSASEGDPDLRAWLVSEMGKLGVPCDIDNILITSGSQQALDYSGKLLIDPQDTMLVGWPTYLGALGAFNAYQPTFDQLTPLGNRDQSEFRATAAQKDGDVKAAYLSVDFANPTGETLSLRARNNVLDLAEALNIAVIEDAAYQALRYDGAPISPIQALEVARAGDINACRTIYCGSFSKTLAPGLRVGWVCAAKSVIYRLVLMKQASDLHSPTLNQMAIAKVARGVFDDHVARIRSVYRARRDHMLAALKQHMPKGVSWSEPEGGMFIWLTLPPHLDGATLLQASLQSEKVAFVPGRAFFADGSGANSLRLSFSRADEAQIEEGMTRLGRLIRTATAPAKG
ncbi:MAG: PLP-dependent aminotransferase family protein [Pseudomonadota bacterium]